MLRNLVLVVAIAAFAAGCSKKKEPAADDTPPPAPADATRAVAAPPDAAPPDAASSQAVLHLDRLYSQAGDRLPIAVRLTVPDGWELVPQKKGPPRLRLKGASMWPDASLAVVVDARDVDEAVEYLDKQLAKIREPAKGWTTEVLDERELPNGRLFAVRTQQDGGPAHLATRCFYRRPDDAYVVVLSAFARRPDDEEILPTFAALCESVEILGPQAAP